MTKFSAGAVTWAVDPIGAHDERPIIVLSRKPSVQFCPMYCDVLGY